MPFLEKLDRVGIELESAEGTAETIVAADSYNLLVKNLSMNVSGDPTPRDVNRQTFSQLPGIPGKAAWDIGFSIDLMGDGTADTVLPTSDLMKCLGFTETEVATAAIGTPFAAPNNSDASGLTVASAGTFSGTSVNFYMIECTTGGALNGETAKVTVTDLFSKDAGATVATPDTAAFVTTATPIDMGSDGCTITFTSTGELTVNDRWYMLAKPADCVQYQINSTTSADSITFEAREGAAAGLKKIAAGVRGNGVFHFETGQPCVLDFTGRGAYSAVTDAGSFYSSVEDSLLAPPVLLNAYLAIDNYAAIVNKVDLDLGNELADNDSANATYGMTSVVRKGRKPTISIDPNSVLVATEDFYGHLRSGRTAYLCFTLGTTAGNKFQFLIGFQYTGITDAYRDGIKTFDINGNVCSITDDGNDEIVFYVF